MVAVNVHEAKTHLSRLLARVESGESIVIARNGRPVARLSPVARARRKPALGTARGQVTFRGDFNAPLPEAVLAEFER